MGIWRTGTLENDTAQDFFAEIIETKNLFKKLLQGDPSKARYVKVTKVLNNSDLDYVFIAACKAIAASQNNPNKQLDKDYLELSRKRTTCLIHYANSFFRYNPT